jgi:hypothetical protein
MSFREKMDWLSLGTLCLFSIYFFEIAKNTISGSQPSDLAYYFKLFWLLVGVHLVTRVAVLMAMLIRSPKEVLSPGDEREVLTEITAFRPAYIVLFVGCLLTIGTLHMGFNTWQFAQCILFVIWIAELSRYGWRLLLYRYAA